MLERQLSLLGEQRIECWLAVHWGTITNLRKQRGENKRHFLELIMYSSVCVNKCFSKTSQDFYLAFDRFQQKVRMFITSGFLPICLFVHLSDLSPVVNLYKNDFLKRNNNIEQNVG